MISQHAICNLLITAGPTREAIDPVRFISNHSSGKMGYALVEAALQQGARVTLISGPTALNPPVGAQVIQVESADQMLAAVLANIHNQDIFIACAAVADYKPEQKAEQKIKKSADTMTLTLVKNPDIVKQVAELSSRPLVVGFAAETENLIDHATRKLQQKKLDLIIANPVGEGLGFHVDQSEAYLIDQHGIKQHFSLQTKINLAQQIMAAILDVYHKFVILSEV